MQVRCACCHRVERWSGAERVVELPGGSRRPVHHAHRATWETLARCLGGEGVAVGVCEGCGQPLVASEGTWACFEIPVGEGALVVGAEGLTDAEGPVSVEEASARVVAAYPDWRLADVKPGLALFQGSLLTLMMVPVALWGMGIFFLFIYFHYFATHGAELVP